MLRRGFALFSTVVLFGCGLGVKTPELLPGLPAPVSEPRGWLPAPEEAEKLIQEKRAERAKSREPESVNSRARAALERGNAVDAAAEYRRALRKDPKDEQLNLGMAKALFQLGELEESAQHANYVVGAGGAATPEAAQLLVTLESSRGRYPQAREAAQSWARWAEQNGQRIMAMDAWLLASRLSHMYLNDPSGTYYALEKARPLVSTTDAEAARRFTNYEAELQRKRMGKF